MAKLLSIIALILTLVLFPPAVLAIVSNNAVPGDTTYPIKRALEDGIYAVASLNPSTKAWFAAARSDRRFKEVTTLLAQGKQATNTLTELVDQTNVAALEIAQVQDPVKKQQLTQALVDSIQKYDQGLAQASQQISNKEAVQPIAPATPAPPQPPQIAQQPPVAPSPQQPTAVTPVPPVATTQPNVAKPTAQPAPTTAASPQTTPVPQPTSVPILQPTPQTNQPREVHEIDDARKKIEEIKNRLQQSKHEQEDKNDSDRNQNRENKDNSKRSKD